MSISVSPFTLQESSALAGAYTWAWLVSDYVKDMFYVERSGDGETVIAFAVWTLMLWCISRHHNKGWSVYWFAFALISFAPFADSIDAAFGGVLGLSSQN